MGFPSSEKSAMGGNNNNTTWVIAGIPMRGPLKPVYTGSSPALEHSENNNNIETEYHPTTPTAECSRIPAKLTCPPPPRKRKTGGSGGGGGGGGRCNNKNKSICNNGKREFFVVPPDLEAIFMRRRHHVGC